MGLILKDVELPFPGHGHVILGDPSHILLYPISSTEARMLVDVPATARKPCAATGGIRQYLLTHTVPQLPAALQNALKAALRSSNCKICCMQNMQLAGSTIGRPKGAVLLGDSFNMRHPLTGAGMTVALSDAKLLCDLLHPVGDLSEAVSVAKCAVAFYTQRAPLAATLNTLANALHEVVQQKPAAEHGRIRQACFDYLALGASFIASGCGALLCGAAESGDWREVPTTCMGAACSPPQDMARALETRHPDVSELFAAVRLGGFWLQAPLSVGNGCSAAAPRRAPAKLTCDVASQGESTAQGRWRSWQASTHGPGCS